jgi:hypothetical protein
VAEAGEQQRAADRDDVEGDDEAAVAELHRVGEVVWVRGDVDRRGEHRCEQHRGDACAERHEWGHVPSAVSSRFEREDGERNEDREDDEGDQQVDPQRASADRLRDVAVDAPPDETFDELMDAEQHRQRRQQEVTAAAA